MTSRYGEIANLADFVRKGQMMNYEGYRAMYEGRQGQMFKPVQGLLMWMSHPGQPSFVWQMYHYDLEPTAAYFAIKKACEPVHLQLNEVGGGTVQVVNNLPTPLAGALAKIMLYNLDGSSAYEHTYNVTAPLSATTDLGKVQWPASLPPVHFVKLELHDAAGKLLSENFYWRGQSSKPDDLTALETLPKVTLDTQVQRREANGKVCLDVTLKNPGQQVALMTHLQLRRGTSKDRVLPDYYSDNYVSLAPREEKTITIEAAASDLKGQKPMVLIDGWNIGVTPVSTTSADIALNQNAQVEQWPKTGLPFYVPELVPVEEVRMNAGGWTRDGFQGDPGYLIGVPGFTTDKVDANVPNAAPEAIYMTTRWGAMTYPFLMKMKPGQTYTVRLHFMELSEKSPEMRVFNISINGKTVLTDLDIFKETGGRFKALVKEFKGIVPDEKGMIVIGMDKGKKGTPQVVAPHSIVVSDEWGNLLQVLRLKLQPNRAQEDKICSFCLYHD